jgi:hypothetical protein
MIRMAHTLILFFGALLILNSINADEATDKKKAAPQAASGKARIQEAPEAKSEKNTEK